jgi:MerR family transcriptional regulator, light-induced transcriptional regulator
MSQFTPREIARFAPGEHGIERFALQVMSILMADGSHLTRPPRDDLLRLLVRGAMTGDTEILGRLSHEFRRLRIPAEAAVDVYIPAAVNEIGAAWHSDEIDVLEATVAFSRLQNLLRELSRGWRADQGHQAATGSVLLVIPEGDQHSLGGMVATAQLRRMGVSVSVQFSPSMGAIETSLQNRHFDAVFLSIANLDSIENAKAIINYIKRVTNDGMRVAVGGSVPRDMAALKAATGADLATRDLKEAIDHLGLDVGCQAAQ